MVVVRNHTNQRLVLVKTGEGAFQMSKNNGNKDTRILRSRKQKIKRRLRRKQWEEQEQPMLGGSNIHYEMGERNGAINCGGIGVFHQMVKKIGLIEEIDAKLVLMKMGSGAFENARTVS